jgi:ATP-dependent DNA ligase
MARVLAPAGADAVAIQPFQLASPLEDPPEALGAIEDWQLEWKWDGIRAQLLRTADGVVFWSRGEERLDGRFPELEAAALRLPEGCLLDGEILAWKDGAPLPFVQLQKRINRLKPGPRLLAECPLRFLAYDALFVRGEDLRGSPLSQRRSALEALLIESLSAPHCGPGVLEETWVRHPREGGDPDLSRPRPLLLDPVPAFARTGSSRGRRIPGSPESSSTAHPCNVAVRALQYDQSLRVLFLESPTGSSPGENPQVQAAAPSVGARRSARATAQVRASVESSADLPTPGVSAQASAPVSNDISAATVEGALLPETHESPDSVFGGRLPTLGISQRIDVRDWTAAEALRASARERGVEGLMLKLADSPWQPGRKRGAWWKWKLDPLSIDAVLIYAQAGHGRRATLYTDYTFALWDGEQLLPIAKAYSGLDDAEILRLDRWIRANTLERFGPVRSVKAELVFELGFEGVNLSSRHKSGVALRFPRILRWREDKLAREADQLSALRRLAERLARAPAGPVE